MELISLVLFKHEIEGIHGESFTKWGEVKHSATSTSPFLYSLFIQINVLFFQKLLSY